MTEKTVSGILERMTIEEVTELAPNVCVIPIGSTEPHGPALPYGSDSFGVEAVCYGGTEKANKLGGGVLCLPTSRIALNNNFRRFPYACRISVPVFMRVLKDLVNMCHDQGADRVVIVNGHGGNTDVIRAVMRDLAGNDTPFVCMLNVTSCASPELNEMWDHRSDHAGEEETSRNLYLNPELVKNEKITANPMNHPKLRIFSEMNAEFVRPWHLYVPASAGGDATKSSAEKGEIFVKSCIERLGYFLSELSKADDNGTFPY